MRIIKVQQDFDILRRAGVLPAALLDQVEEYFNQLRFEQEDQDSSEFCLTSAATSSFCKQETTSATSVTSG
jgi:hypothetical protein